MSWSPDGKWLVFDVYYTDLYIPTSTTGLLNLENCQVIPLINLNGTIQTWVNP